MKELSKKYPVMLAATLALATVALTGISPVSANTEAVSASQAQEIALKDAGLTADQVHSLKVSSDEDNDRPVYEIEFKHHNSEYDYTISAENGHITEKDADIDDRAETTNASATSNKAGLTADEAKAIALKDAGLAEAEVTKLKVKTDQDNNRPVFEIEFEKGQTDYDYTVDASSGQITEKDID